MISVGILALALLLTPIGAAHVSWLQSTTLEAYAGVGLLAVALLKAVRARFTRRRSGLRLFFAFASAVAFALMGFWLLAVWFYESGVAQWPFKFGTFPFGGSLPAYLNAFDMTIVPLLAPFLAVLFGIVLSAKQLKTIRQAIRERRRSALAYGGFLASACALTIGAYAGEYRYFGDPWDDFGAANSAAQNSLRAYGPLFGGGVPCHISDGFGVRRNPFDKGRLEFHPGLDIAVAPGTPVHAMTAGTVVFSGANGGFGNMVAIRASDGGPRPITLVAAHMQHLLVATGSIVQSGDFIGLAGTTGRSTGPHVHLQVCLNGRTNRAGRFVCGAVENPYESWRTLSAIAQSSCARGPIV